MSGAESTPVRPGLILRALIPAVLLAALPAVAPAQSLKGSKASVARQNHQARAHDFTYLVTPHQLQRFVKAGILVRVPGNADYELAGVSYPYARPEVKLFIERLARQYRAATGEKLVVTSLTRPKSRQPRNASRESVHPTGMAIDIRRPKGREGRRWLERVFLQLEKAGVIEATRERRPPHYHVAVFPKPYLAYLDRITEGELAAVYRVSSGDSLWAIARRHGTTVEALKQANDMRGASIYPGQVLKIPAAR